MNKTIHTRRQFLRTSVLGGALAWSVPVFLERTFFTLDAMAADSMTPTGKDAPILVVLQLAGGNDGLNTLVPFRDDSYLRARPTLAIKNPLKITDELGLHPRLSGLRGLYDEGHLGIIQGVGYPNPNRSHFRSTEIWQTASDAEKSESHGWIGRYFDACCKGDDPCVGVSIGSQTPQAFAAELPKGVSFSKPEQFRFASERDSNPDAADEFFRTTNEQGVESNDGGSVGMLQGPSGSQGDTMDFLRRTALDAQLSSDKVLEITRKSKASVPYPASNLADSLNLVARLIAGGLPTRVYYIGQGGYDTHSNQANSHDRLMGEMDAALTAFTSDLKAQGNFDRVLLMTFSEFGRRVAENGSGGTDHGAAAPLFVAGGGIKAGLHGATPSLTALHDGDLVHTVDFRSVYATILKNWLNVPAEPILHRAFPTLGFV